MTKRLQVLLDDAELILHRYTALATRDAIGPAFDAILGVVDDVLPIMRSDVERARWIVQTTARLSARDALHVALMQGHGIDQVMSFYVGFDEMPGLRRIAA